MKTYYIESLGCAKNLVDTEIFAAILHRAGLEAVVEPEEADLVLLNTCAFLQDSLLELELVLEDLIYSKQDNPTQKLLVTGCIMNRAASEYQEAYPDVDAWLDLKDFAALEKYLHLEHQETSDRAAIQCGFHRYLRISDGCSNNCTYCTIPSIRGTMHSVPLEDLLREAKALAEDADCPALELVVIAQDTANYGVDLYGRQALPELLTKLHEIPQFQWIRLMYLHPDHFDLSWLPLWKKLPKLLPYFEIPIQHSEDHLLKAMNRHKNRAQLLKMFTEIRRELPNAALRTTLISGFPGESKADAIALRRFIKQVHFTHLGVFLYSPEKGTPAAALAEQVPLRTAERRRIRIFALQNDLATEGLDSYVDETVAVLVEKIALDDEDDIYIGRAWFQAPEVDGITYVHGIDLRLGEIYQVRIDDVIDVDLFGEAVFE